MTGATTYGLGWSLPSTTSFKDSMHSVYGVSGVVPVGSFLLTAPANNSKVVLDQKCVISGDLTNVTSVTYWANNGTINLGTSNVSPFSLDIDINLIPNAIYTVEAHVSDSVLGVTKTIANTFISEVDKFKNGTTHYVDVTGSDLNNGTELSPWSITHAMSGNEASILPGDTILMQAGDYAGQTSKCYIKGTALNPILVKAVGDVKVNFSDNVATAGFVWFWGIRPNDTNPERDFRIYARPSGFYLTTEGMSVINCILSNVGHPAIGHWVGCKDSSVYGNIIWGTGQYGQSPYIRGSAVYAQNDTGTRSYGDNVTFRNFTNGLKPYAESGFVRGFEFTGNTSFFNRGAPYVLYSENSVERIKLIENYSYDNNTGAATATRIGYNGLGVANTGLEIRDNYLYGSTRSQTGVLDIRMFNDLTVRDNTIITEHTLNAGETPRLFSHYPTATETNIDWDNNTYWGGRDISIGADNVINDHIDYLTNDYHTSLAQWQTARPAYDVNSTYTKTLPISNAVFNRPNQYERGRGHITIYNWESLLNVDVDISVYGLEEGEAYEIRDIQNLFAIPAISGTYTYASRIVSVPMNLSTVSAVVDNHSYELDPLAGDLHSDMLLCEAHSDSKFGTFLIIKQGVI